MESTKQTSKRQSQTYSDELNKANNDRERIAGPRMKRQRQLEEDINTNLGTGRCHEHCKHCYVFFFVEIRCKDVLTRREDLWKMCITFDKCSYETTISSFFVSLTGISSLRRQQQHSHVLYWSCKYNQTMCFIHVVLGFSFMKFRFKAKNQS